MSWKKEIESHLKYPFSLDNQFGPAYLKIAAPPSLTAGFTLRPGGFSHGSFASANMSFQVGDQEEAVAQNRRALLYGAGVDFFSALVTAKQVHGNRCLTVVDQDPEKLAQLAQTGADALLTDQPGILLGVMTADCLPLIMIDRLQRAVAVVHVGWRGLDQAIGVETVAQLSRDFAVEAENLQIFAGPAICSCCFQVGIEVVDRFRRQPVWPELTVGIRSALQVTILICCQSSELSFWLPGLPKRIFTRLTFAHFVTVFAFPTVVIML